MEEYVSGYMDSTIARHSESIQSSIKVHTYDELGRLISQKASVF
jgi:hypothetical protein